MTAAQMAMFERTALDGAAAPPRRRHPRRIRLAVAMMMIWPVLFTLPGAAILLSWWLGVL